MIGSSLGCLSRLCLPTIHPFENASGSEPPAWGWLAERCAGDASVAPTLPFFGKPAGWRWEHFGLLWEKWMSPSSPLLSLTAHPALGKPFLVFVPLSPDGKAGHGAQCLTPPCSLSCFLIHGPGLSCFAFISSCSPISLSIYKPYFYAVRADLDMKLTCCMIPNSLGILLFLFFPVGEIIYCR